MSDFKYNRFENRPHIRSLQTEGKFGLMAVMMCRTSRDSLFSKSLEVLVLPKEIVRIIIHHLSVLSELKL